MNRKTRTWAQLHDHYVEADHVGHNIMGDMRNCIRQARFLKIEIQKYENEIAYYKELKENTEKNEIRLLEEQIEEMKLVIEKAGENRMSVLERNRNKRLRQNIKKMQANKVELAKKLKRYERKITFYRSKIEPIQNEIDDLLEDAEQAKESTKRIRDFIPWAMRSEGTWSDRIQK